MGFHRCHLSQVGDRISSLEARIDDTLTESISVLKQVSPPGHLNVLILGPNYIGIFLAKTSLVYSIHIFLTRTISESCWLELYLKLAGQNYI